MSLWRRPDGLEPLTPGDWSSGCQGGGRQTWNEVQARAGLPPALSFMQAGHLVHPPLRVSAFLRTWLSQLCNCVCEGVCARRWGQRSPGPASLEGRGSVAGVGLLVTDSSSPAAFFPYRPNVSSGRFPCSNYSGPAEHRCFPFLLLTTPILVPPSRAGWGVESGLDQLRTLCAPAWPRGLRMRNPSQS